MDSYIEKREEILRIRNNMMKKNKIILVVVCIIFFTVSYNVLVFKYRSNEREINL